MSKPELTQKLQVAVAKMHSPQAWLLSQTWASGGKPEKAMLALMRGWAYAQAGRPQQALKVTSMRITAQMQILHADLEECSKLESIALLHAHKQRWMLCRMPRCYWHTVPGRQVCRACASGPGDMPCMQQP